MEETVEKILLAIEIEPELSGRNWVGKVRS